MFKVGKTYKTRDSELTGTVLWINTDRNFMGVRMKNTTGAEYTVSRNLDGRCAPEVDTSFDLVESHNRLKIALGVAALTAGFVTALAYVLFA